MVVVQVIRFSNRIPLASLQFSRYYATEAKEENTQKQGFCPIVFFKFLL